MKVENPLGRVQCNAQSHSKTKGTSEPGCWIIDNQLRMLYTMPFFLFSREKGEKAKEKHI